MKARSIVINVLVDTVGDTSRSVAERAAAVCELVDRLRPAVDAFVEACRQIVEDWPQSVFAGLASAGTTQADDEPDQSYNGEPLPDGCWASVWSDPALDYVPCNRAPDSNVGLCAGHADDLRRIQIEGAGADGA